MVEIDLNFKGYYYPNDSAIPDSPGVYCVYSTRQAQQSNTASKKRELVELRYIGQSGTGNATLRSRIRQHATSDYPASEHCFYYAYSSVKLRTNQFDQLNQLRACSVSKNYSVFTMLYQNSSKTKFSRSSTRRIFGFQKDTELALNHLNQLDMVEAALVFHFKPRDNGDNGKALTVEKYTHSDVDVSISGDCAGLEKSFRLFSGTEMF